MDQEMIAQINDRSFGRRALFKLSKFASHLAICISFLFVFFFMFVLFGIIAHRSSLVNDQPTLAIAIQLL
jgi:hypothetical protein